MGGESRKLTEFFSGAPYGDRIIMIELMERGSDESDGGCQLAIMEI